MLSGRPAERRRRALRAFEVFADPAAHADRSGGGGAVEVESVRVHEPVGVADLAAQADGEGLAGFAPAAAAAG